MRHRIDRWLQDHGAFCVCGRSRFRFGRGQEVNVMTNEDAPPFAHLPPTGDRLAFAAPSTRSKVIMEDFMPIRIRHRDMIIASTQQSDISLFMPDAILVSQASYTAFEAVFGVLCGSI